MSEKILVTGSTGFVGSAVVRALLAKGKSVRVLVRPSANLGNIADLDVEIAHGDLLNKDTLKEAMKGVTHLYHVAADYRLWVPKPDAMDAINVDGTKHLMEAALEEGVKKIVYCSSVATLPTAKNGVPSDESKDHSLDDVIGAYKKSKYKAEKMVMRMVEEQKLPAVTVMPSTPIGPYDIKPTPTGQVILDVLTGKMPAYVETGLNLVHVDDVANGHLLAMEKGVIGERYILGGENEPLIGLFRMIAQYANVKVPSIRLNPNMLYPIAIVSEWLARGFGYTPRVTREMLMMSKKLMYFSSDKARKELGYHARPATEAVRDAVVWFCKEHNLSVLKDTKSK